MPANPVDVARYTSDGVLLTDQNAVIKDQDPNALDTGDRELGLFFDNPAHGQIVLDELFNFVSGVGRPHEAVEIADGLGLGSLIPVWPRAPQADLVDEQRSINTPAVIRAYGFDMGSDVYVLELVGIVPRLVAGSPTFDSDTIRFDNTVVTWDRDAGSL